MGKPHNSEAKAETPDRPEEVGAQLRKAREACRLSIPSAAATLRLHPKVIIALETNDFQQFAPVYVRGYLRNYARLLNLTVEPLIETYNRTLTPAAPIAPPPPQPQPSKGRAFTLNPAHVLLAVAGLTLLLWGATRAFQTLGTLDEPSPRDVVARPLPVTSTPDAPNTLALPPNQPAATLPKPPPPAEKPAAETAKPAAAAAAAPTPTGQGPDRIILRLSSSGWVSIRDQAGRRLVYENLPADAERALQGQAPFAVVLGNAQATQIEFNGQPFDIPKVKAGTVARFKLGGPAAGGTR
ncbi:MAG: helix-turn-helix domain-containing protein [Candidatus Methylumidiphilus sp.]